MTRNSTTAARSVRLVVLVLIAPYAGAQNLLTNPSFDNDGAGWIARQQQSRRGRVPPRRRRKHPGGRQRPRVARMGARL